MSSKTSNHKKILLIEPATHFEVVRAVGDIFLELGYKVDVLTIPFCLPYLNTWADENQVVLKNLKDQHTVEYDHYHDIVLTSPDKERIEINHPNTFLIIHNLNYWLAPYQNLSFLRNGKIKSLLRAFKYVNPITIFKNKRYLHSFKAVLAPSQLMYENSENSIVRGFLEISYSSKPALRENNGGFKRIIIPGSGFKDRNISMIIQVVNQLALEKKEKIELVILGADSDQLKLSRTSYKLLSIITFRGMISQDQYDENLRNAAMAIIPINEFKDYKGVWERRGYSNLTGSINDVIRMGIPTLIPEYYPVPNLLRDLFYTYSSEEKLYDLLEKVIYSSPDNSLISPALENYSRGMLEKQKAILNSLDA